jgi:methionine-rich copper-binding protein CopC
MITHRTIRPRFSLLFALSALLAATLAPATPALAHASVLSVQPTSNTVLSQAPTTLSVSFNEPVSTSATKVQLLNGTGRVLPTRFSTLSAGSSFALKPTTRLLPGGYALRWSVLSADGHVVVGASSFWVGPVPRPGTALTVPLVAGATSSKVSLSSNKRGLVSFTPPPGTALVEFRHAKISAPLTATLTPSSASVILPVAGSWNLTLVVKNSEFSETRFLGTFTLR